MRRETDYAIHLLKYLAKRKNQIVSLKELSSATGISFLFLQKIARKLRLAKLINAEKGMIGGYELAMPPSKISLKNILLATEGAVDILPCYCAEKKVKCVSQGKKCHLQGKLSGLNNNVGKMLSKIKLSSL